MAKRLMLLRHAKSAWDQPELSDTERPLSKRGRRAAPLIGQFMLAEGLIPISVLCSTAVRARETWDLVAATWPHPPPQKPIAELYMSTPRDILAILRNKGGDAASLLVIGHNPGLGDLANWLADDGDAEAISRMRQKFPTTGLAIIDLP
ncbi:MAG: histidine phosphatase family protein, partial [Dongiaceae bacterium]